MPPIVIAHHLIWTSYGWWLPNDLRGSYSKTIESDILADLGQIHYGRQAVQPASRDIRQFYEEAKKLLKYPLLAFTPKEILAVAAAFRDVVLGQRYTCYACAIMPDHVHLIIRKHKHLAEEMMELLKESSRLRLSHLGFRDPSLDRRRGLESLPRPPR